MLLSDDARSLAAVKLPLALYVYHTYNNIMNLIWDPDKAADNRVKHGVSFPDVEAVFYDPYAITREDDSSEGEPRWVSLGLDNLGRVVVVVYTYRGDTIRLISARKATRNEVRAYERGI